MKNQEVRYLLEDIFDEYIINDIKKKTEKDIYNYEIKKIEELSNIFLLYIKQHYYIYNDYMVSKISNYYGKHKNFTRFLLICISIFDEKEDICDIVQKYKFCKLSNWHIEHIIPQSQEYNKFNNKNLKLINRLGNLTLLTKDTNIKISNKLHYEKCKIVTSESVTCEKNLRINQVFFTKKSNFSKVDILNREKELNDIIFEIFFKENGKLLKEKLTDYINKKM